jgi:hypothetical protein
VRHIYIYSPCRASDNDLLFRVPELLSLRAADNMVYGLRALGRDEKRGQRKLSPGQGSLGGGWVDGFELSRYRRGNVRLWKREWWVNFET